jgi:hypothetical protein
LTLDGFQVSAPERGQVLGFIDSAKMDFGNV